MLHDKEKFFPRNFFIQFRLHNSKCGRKHVHLNVQLIQTSWNVLSIGTTEGLFMLIFPPPPPVNFSLSLASCSTQKLRARFYAAESIVYVRFSPFSFTYISVVKESLSVVNGPWRELRLWRKKIIFLTWIFYSWKIH